MESAFFWFFAAVALASALSVILQKKAMHSALSLLLCLASIAFLYLLLEAQFIAVLQIIIYAGAIVVLFLFVIMLLDPRADAAPGRSRRMAAIAVPLGLLFLGLLAAYMPAGEPAQAGGAGAVTPDPALGHVENIGRELFARYLLPFEAISVLILIAIVGAVVLAKRKI